MPEKNKITAFISGKEYTLVGNESEEYIAKVARYVDKKMHDVSVSSNMISASMVGILVALNVADDYFKLLEKIESGDDFDKDKEIENLKAKLLETEEQQYAVKKEMEKLKIELTAAKVLLDAKNKAGQEGE